MQKHLFLFSWICAILVALILLCLGYLAYLLLSPNPAPAGILSGVRLVWEATRYAAV